MRCNALGQPDPAGQYVLRDGQVILDQGSYVGFNMAFMDTAATVRFTDAERAFLDSPAGQQHLAYAHTNFVLAQAHRGVDARHYSATDRAADERRIVDQQAAFDRFMDAQRNSPAAAAAKALWEQAKANRNI